MIKLIEYDLWLESLMQGEEEFENLVDDSVDEEEKDYPF